MNSKVRIDLGDNALIGAVARLGDDGGPVAAVWIEDPGTNVRIGFRLRAVEQADELLRAVTEARTALTDDLDAMIAGFPERRTGSERRTHDCPIGTNLGRRKADRRRNDQ